jgi:hypothetical protein
MEARPYQALTVSQIQLQQANLIIAPQRSGKSFIMSLAIDSHKFSKVLIIVGFRKIVTQLASYFPDDHTFILAGKEYDHSKRVHLASFQTFANRDITLDQYDCIIIDEFHSRTSQAVYELVNQPNCTKLLFTGTPLTNSNKLITKGIDHYIQPTTVKELLDNSWLAPTRFMSNSNILGEHAADLKTNKTDFDESMVRQIIKKEDLLQNVLNLIIKHELDTKHKAVIYVNFISTAEELYELIKHRNNVFIVHSKLTQSQQELALSEYESASNAVLINVRALSLGWDSPTTDTIIYAMFTKIHSLALQIMWRASTVNPTNPDKVATVYDLVGQLGVVNPYTDFKAYSKKKSCRDLCNEQYADSPMEHYFCMEGCSGDPVLIKCSGELAYSHQSNPFISNFQVTAGEPCGESKPSWEFQFKQTDNGIGSITKWSKCSCGCVTRYDVQTLADPSEMIPVYDDSITRHTVTIIYSAAHRKALALFDHTSKPRYKVLMFDSSEELYKEACEFFKSQPFQIIANRPMPKLPNVAVNRELDSAVDLISWGSTNSGFVKKLIKLKLAHIAEFFGFKPGFTYYVARGITPENEKSILSHLGNTSFERSEFLKYCTKLQNSIKEP